MPRLTPSSSKAPSQRMLRVAELIRHALAEALQRGEIVDPVLEGKVITVPEVKMSPDLKVATVYVMPLGGRDGQAVIKALATHAKFLRGYVAKRVTMKYAPNFRFLLDTTFDYATKVDGLLRQPEVSRDLENKLPGSEPDEE
jgi:ribosome-binding factor A